MTTSTMRRLAQTVLVASVSIGGPALTASWPTAAIAGMGAVLPHWHRKPCSGDDCRADDPRANESCKGLLCTFSSAKAMAPPVTASQAAEAERARAAAVESAANAQAAAAPVEPAQTKKRKHVAKAKTHGAAPEVAAAGKAPDAVSTSQATR